MKDSLAINGKMSEMYESMMKGLKEDLQDIQTHGEPQGRKTDIEKRRESENRGKRKAALCTYIQNKASLGTCAQIADMSREDFLSDIWVQMASRFFGLMMNGSLLRK